jgi:arylformamidase
MTGRVHDVSLAIGPGLPTWPTSTGFGFRRAMALASGDAANVTVLDMDVHTGTHIESALHFLPDGQPLDGVPLDRFVGPAVVVEVHGASVTAESLEALGVPAGTQRLLIKTANSARWVAGWGPFDPAYVALTRDAATWVVDREIELVGIDHLSIQRYEDDGETHRILMRAGVVILEGLNLGLVEPGEYTLVAAPLRLVGTEAAPVRAILMGPAE